MDAPSNQPSRNLPVGTMVLPKPMSDAGSATARRVLLLVAAAIVSLASGLALTQFSPALVVAGVLALVASLLILRLPFIGLLVYTLLFELRLGELYPTLGTLHLERLVGILTLAGYLGPRIYRSREVAIDRSTQTRLLLAFVFFILPSIPFAYWRPLALSGFFEFLRVVAFYLMVVHIVDSPRRLRGFLWIYCLMIVWQGVQSSYGYFSGHAALAQGIERATGATDAAGNANKLGTTMACGLPLFLLMTLRLPEKKRLLFGLGCGVMLITLVITGSRASLLGFLAGLTVLWWKSRHRAVLAVLGALLLAACFQLIPAQYQGRYSTIVSSNLDYSSMSRVTTWLTGLRMVVERPLTGVGIGCFGVANGVMTRSWLSSHSLYLQVIGETGIPGALVFFWFLFEILRTNRRVRRTLDAGGEELRLERIVLDGVLAGLVVLLVSGIFGHSLLRRTWYVFAALDLAILRTYLRGSIREPAIPGRNAPEPAP